MEIKISVRNLVEFLLRGGNIDNRRSKGSDNAMQEGSRIHRMIQKRMGIDYHTEVGLRFDYETENYTIVIEGRADGIIIPHASQATLPGIQELVTIDEIKSTYKDLSKITEAAEVHIAQAKCYAYIYAMQNQREHMRVQLTYCNIDTEDLKYFRFDYTIFELRVWFEDLMEQYRKWSDYEYEWRQVCTASIKELEFPFPYRDGQKNLAAYVYRTIYHKKKFFIEAPTGVGKTISTVFPAVKAIGEGLGEKIFYLTAKTITRTVADNTFSLLREKGLKFKTVLLTARDKICFMEESECNPEYCPYAKGHYDRINEAVYDLLTNSDNFNRETIEEYARKHMVCPFEMCLDMSLFADGIICDYNYLFDPHVYLKRFFSEGISRDYLFLIDEAHNLVERGREMYSAVITKEAFLTLKKTVKEHSAPITKQLEKCNKELLILKRECEECQKDQEIEPFVRALTTLSAAIDKYLEDHEDSPVKKEIMEFYFVISHFLMIYEKMDENYVVYSWMDSGGEFSVKLFCVNPAKNLKECMVKGRSTILFSATLLPINYYKRLLGADEGDYEVYAKSVFNPKRAGLFIANDVTSKYTRRNELEYYNIVTYIHQIIECKSGNYMVFFPSHAFLQKIYEVYDAYYGDDTQVECVLQEDYMSEESREAFLARFTGNDDCNLEESICMDIEVEEERTLLGFCVLGGIFSEGIDLKNDNLIGAIIVGTGLPQVCYERELLKEYFDENGENGFDFAYRYPGMNKVLQAAGRVIRTTEDIGVIALLDERFLNRDYQRMFPIEWSNREQVTLRGIGQRVEDFWKEWY